MLAFKVLNSLVLLIQELFCDLITVPQENYLMSPDWQLELSIIIRYLIQNWIMYQIHPTVDKEITSTITQQNLYTYVLVVKTNRPHGSI